MRILQIQDRVRRDEIDEWELRAIREKKLAREQWDFYWAVQQMEHMDMINTPPSEQRDVRYVPKLYAPLLNPPHVLPSVQLPMLSAVMCVHSLSSINSHACESWTGGIAFVLLTLVLVHLRQCGVCACVFASRAYVRHVLLLLVSQ